MGHGECVMTLRWVTYGLRMPESQMAMVPGPHLPARGGPGRLIACGIRPSQQGEGSPFGSALRFGGELQPAAGGGVQAFSVGDHRADARAAERLGQRPE